MKLHFTCIAVIVLFGTGNVLSAASDPGAYDRGMRALREHRWPDALGIFGQIAAENSDRSDAALYWQAYSMKMLSRPDDALAECHALSMRYPTSKWNSDCDSLALVSFGNTHIPKVPKVSRPPQTDGAKGGNASDSIRMLTLNSQLRSTPTEAASTVRRILGGSDSDDTKRHVLFVVFQYRSKETDQIISELLNGQFGKPLQLQAIELSGTLRGKADNVALVSLYQSTSPPEIKRAVASSLFVSHDAEHLIQLVKAENDAEMKSTIISYLAVMNDKAAHDFLLSLLK